MYKLIAASLFVCLVLGTSSCTLYRIDFEETSLKVYAPKASADEVTYFETAKKPHEVIGYVTINAERNQKLEEIIKKLRREAAMLGGDAVANITTDGGNGIWARIKPKRLFGNSHIRANFKADVVVFK